MISLDCAVVPVIVTTSGAGTELAIWTLSVPVLEVQPPGINGCPFAMIEATAGSLLVSFTWIPLAGAMLATVAFTNPIPPGANADGVEVKVSSGGSGNSVPPGLSVTA